MILTPSRESTANIRAATPECERIPTPTSDTLAMASVTPTDFASISLATRCTRVTALPRSTRGTVNEISVSSAWLTFWMIISTMMFASATGPKIRAAMPGRSGTPIIVILA